MEVSPYGAQEVGARRCEPAGGRRAVDAVEAAEHIDRQAVDVVLAQEGALAVAEQLDGGGDGGADLAPAACLDDLQLRRVVASGE